MKLPLYAAVVRTQGEVWGWDKYSLGWVCMTHYTPPKTNHQMENYLTDREWGISVLGGEFHDFWDEVLDEYRRILYPPPSRELQPEELDLLGIGSIVETDTALNVKTMSGWGELVLDSEPRRKTLEAGTVLKEVR